MEIRVWICPTEGCGNYFGTKNSEDQPLQSRVVGARGINGERFGPERHRPRSACPDCFARGQTVERIPAVIQIDLNDLRAAPADDAVSV